MSRTRRGVLIFGPLVLVGGLYWYLYGGRSLEADPPDPAPPQSVVGVLSPRQQRQLEHACSQQAAQWKQQLGPNCSVVVQPPYVLAGNLSAAQLEGLHRHVVAPVTRALQTCYFDRRPTEPISLLLFSTEQAFEDYARRLNQQRRSCYSGYYLRNERRIVVNIATGHGTLAHELTHALSHFDCPDLPEWFDEGLASLHEECDFSPDGLRLLGRSNWRLRPLADALDSGTLPSVESLMATREIRSTHEAVTYAQARYFCLYLQERRLLIPYYRKLKATIATDPDGILALKDLLHTDSLSGFDRDFRRWLTMRRK